MPRLNYRSRLIVWITLLVMFGFLTISIASYVVSRNAVRDNIAAQELPLTGDNIYSELQKDILRPVFISSLMAQDTFVRDWLLRGERDAMELTRYLAEVKQRYNTITAFLVSEKSRTYYHAGGILKKVRENEPRDLWYFRVREMKSDYETNVDPDMANRDAMTIFTNYRVFDFKGNLIGATGVGLKVDNVRGLIDAYQKRFDREIYFLDNQGNVVLTGSAHSVKKGNIREWEGLREQAATVLSKNTVPLQLEYKRQGALILLNTRFIPELDWYLVVEQNEASATLAQRRIFGVNLAIGAIVTLAVLGLMLMFVARYQRRIEKMATTDHLTGLSNRQGLALLFDHTMKQVARYGEAMSVVLFDLDHFKAVNDTHGHLAGDRVIAWVAQTVKQTLRESDVLARWGGEEFLIVMMPCDLAQALQVGEKIRAAVQASPYRDNDLCLPLSVSVGVAQYQPGESVDALLARADRALYRAKQLGRNRVESLNRVMPVAKDLRQA